MINKTLSSSLPRRAVLRGLAAAALLPAASKQVDAGTIDADGAHDTAAIARQFSHKPKLVHLNAAHLSPMPGSVRDALFRADELIDRAPTRHTEEEIANERERLRHRLAQSLGVTADEIALVRNATEANNTLVAGLTLRRGDEVVVWNENHESNNIAWDVRAARDGFSVTRVVLPERVQAEHEIVDAFLRVCTRRTRVLAITQVSNLSGLPLPVAALSSLCRQRGIFVHVDGAQSWGVQPIDLRALGCDSFCASAHKWFLGPRENGLLYVRAERIESIWPSVVGLHWGTSVHTVLRGARKFDNFGQRNDGTVAAMHAALDFQQQLGIERIRSHSRAFIAEVRDHCRQLRLTARVPDRLEFASGILVLRTNESSRAAIAQQLLTAHGIAVSTKGGIRISAHVYNDAADLDRLRDALIATAPLFRT